MRPKPAKPAAPSLSGTTHIRVRREAVDRLRRAVALSGGRMWGCVLREASLAMEQRAELLVKEAVKGRQAPIRIACLDCGRVIEFSEEQDYLVCRCGETVRREEADACL